MEDIIVNNSITIPASAVKFKFSRSSGKGGQNVNKVSTKVEMLFDLGAILSSDRTKLRIWNRLSNKLDADGVLRIVCQESRSQWQNKQTAIDKLIAVISEAAFVERERVATRPTRSSKIVRVEQKKKEGRRKELRRKDLHGYDD